MFNILIIWNTCLNIINQKILVDKIALAFSKFLRFLADTFFRKKYGHRAVVLETVAAPGMVAGMLIHLSLYEKCMIMVGLKYYLMKLRMKECI